jgi:hypothetical protein
MHRYGSESLTVAAARAEVVMRCHGDRPVLDREGWTKKQHTAKAKKGCAEWGKTIIRQQFRKDVISLAPPNFATKAKMTQTDEN